MRNIVYTIICLLICSVSFADQKQTDKFSAYYGTPPTHSEKAYLNSELKDFEIDSESLEIAIDNLIVSFQKYTKVLRPSAMIRKPINSGTKKPIKKPIRITKRTVTLAEAVNTICVQAGVSWSYSKGRITIR